MRQVALDVHKTFCEVAIREGTKTYSAGRVATERETLELFAQSLCPTDEVAMEATGPAMEIARILEPHVARVVVANAQEVRAISHARVKSDRFDARTLANLLGAGMLESVWVPDAETQGLRRRVARRASLVRQRTRAKNEIRAALSRSLLGRSPVVDHLHRRGARLAGGPEAGCRGGRDGPRAVCARSTSSTARSPRSARGEEAPRHGPISKRGNAQARTVLVEAAWMTLRQPGPLRAFGERVRARRGSQVAAVAVARKIACLAWQLLTKEEDYVFAEPSRVRAKLRRVELDAGAPRLSKRHGGQRISATASEREAERELVTRGEVAYRRLIADWKATGPTKGAGATPGRASSGPSMGQAARAGQSPRACALARRRRRPTEKVAHPRQSRGDRRTSDLLDLTFIRTVAQWVSSPFG